MSEESGSTINASNMNFSQALQAIKSGFRTARKGWNGASIASMWIALATPSEGSRFRGYITTNVPFKTLPFLVMKTADCHLVPWLASQTDLLAEDWYLV
jgi:hypothetical protein